MVMSLEKYIWRVIELGRKDGISNIAAERAIFDYVTAGKSPPTLLLTEWEPTVSLGRSQNYRLDVDEKACRKHGVGIVRRHSGGQAVYIDEGYFVFSAIASTKKLTSDVTYLRKSFCDIAVETLNKMNIPARFYQPDNLVVMDPYHKTLGNSGQVIRPNMAVVAQGSIRHHISDIDIMLDVLKVNGHKLQQHTDEIRSILTDTVSYNPEMDKDSLKKSFIDIFFSHKGRYENGRLTYDEMEKAKDIAEKEKKSEWIVGDDSYHSRGVCYFFLNGKNLVPSLNEFLAYNEPSTVNDSIVK